jgi:hypothetical protein
MPLAMPDPHRIRRETKELLSRPAYSFLFAKTNQFAKPGTNPITPQSVAERTADYLWRNNPLLNPVEIVELRGRTELYRAHDGGARTDSARTLGRSWIERPVFEDVWAGTAKYQGKDRRNRFLEFVRTANFVLPEWNDMTSVVCMTVPSGCSVVAVRGRGNWKAMQTASNKPRPGGAGSIHTAGDVLREGMMPTPGLVQCIVPLINDMWIQPVDQMSNNWPFAT